MENPTRSADEIHAAARLANELARRTIAGHRLTWPVRRLPSALRPLERALESGAVTPEQARVLLAEVWEEVYGTPLPLEATAPGALERLAGGLSRAAARGLVRGGRERAA